MTAIVIAASYPEGSTLAIARAFQTDAVYVGPLVSGTVPPSLRWIPGADRLDVRLRRYDPRHGGPTAAVGGTAEIVAKIIAVSDAPPWLSSKAMYASKRAFARRVAHYIRRFETPLLVGLPGSSATAFTQTRRRGGLAVLNAVNGHPRAQNRLLREKAGVTSGPEWIDVATMTAMEREIQYADRILVPSPLVSAQFVEQGVPIDKLVLEPYGVDVEYFSPRSNLTNRTRCVFVGQISRRKGVPILLEAARLLKGTQFRLELFGPIVDASALTNLPANTTYRGRLDRQSLRSLLWETQVFVMPSVEDAYPLAVLEAIAAGARCVVTDQVGTAETVAKEQVGSVVPAGQPRALADAIALEMTTQGNADEFDRGTLRRWDEYGADVAHRIQRWRDSQ